LFCNSSNHINKEERNMRKRIGRTLWLTPINLAAKVADIIAAGSQHRQIVHKTLSHKNPPQKRASAVD
jgi:ribosomal protein L20